MRAGARTQPARMPSHAANTQSISNHAIGSAPIGTGPLAAGPISILEGAYRKMVDLAVSLHRMWTKLMQQHGW